jgi:phenylalanyl-tRNA synthetase alpha chain
MAILLSDLEKQLTTLQATALEAIANTQSLEALEQLRVDYLGKKGELSQILRGMGQLAAEERPAIGAAANVVKDAIQAKPIFKQHKFRHN